MDTSINTNLNNNSNLDSGLSSQVDTTTEAEFNQLMSGGSSQAFAANVSPQVPQPTQSVSAGPASVSPEASKFAKAFGGADGYGGDGHDRAKLQAAGLSYDSNGPTSIQDVLNAAGNVNQFHISADGQAQTQRVFALAEAEGMTQDGYLSASELTRLKDIIENPSLASTPQGQALAQAIAADAAQAGSWTGSPETGGHSSSAPAVEASPPSNAGVFNFNDFLMNMLGLNIQQILDEWKNGGREGILSAVKTQLENSGMSAENVESTLNEFSQRMDAGDVEGATSLIEGAINGTTEASVL